MATTGGVQIWPCFRGSLVCSGILKRPRSFQQYVEAKLAAEIAGPLTQEGGDLGGLARDRLKDAQAKDVINEPTRQQPVSSWVRARFGSNIDRQRRAGSS